MVFIVINNDLSFGGCEVGTNFTLSTFNGGVKQRLDVNMEVIQQHSPFFKGISGEEKSIIFYGPEIDDLRVIVDYYMRGVCTVSDSRLDSVYHLTKILEFHDLHKKMKNIVSPEKESSAVFTVAKLVPLSGEDGGKRTIKLIDISDEEDDSENLTSNAIDDDKDATSNEGMTRDLVAQPALQPKPHIPSHYKRWTKFQNETFLRLWLKYIREKASAANRKIRDEMATIGLCVSNDNVYYKKRKFKELYKQYLKGKHQPLILDYLNQMARIYVIERNLVNSVDNYPPESSAGNVNNDSTMASTSASLQSVKPHELPETDDESHIDHDLIPLNMVEVVMTEKGKFEGADMVYTDGNETVSSSGSVQVIDEPLESQYVAEFHEISDRNSDFSDSALFSENEMEQTTSAQQGDTTTLKGLPRQRRFNRWTPKQNEIFLKYWLKRARNECKDATSRMRDELANNGIQVKTNMIGARKQMFRKMYDGHLNGQNQPYILDYVKEMAMIYEAEVSDPESSKGAQRYV